MPVSVFGEGEKQITPAQDCQSLQCVRNNIDIVDDKIVVLIGQRLAYVRRAGELKKNQFTIHDSAREKKILHKVELKAKQQGYPSEIAIDVFKTLLASSNRYEQKYHRYSK